MDPLSISASLIAVLQLTTAVITICYDYRQGTKSASQEAIRITNELNSLKDVLEALLRLVESSDASRLSTVAMLAKSNGPLENCLKEMEKLKDKLEPETGWRKARNSLLWPLKEGEIKKMLEKLEANKSMIGLALSADQTTLSLAISDDLDDLTQLFQRHSLDQKRQDINTWLGGPDPSANHLANRKKRQPQSGTWLFQSKQYEHWLQGANSLLWIYGIPGSGKTILCSTIIDQLARYTQEVPEVALAYFYYDFNDTSKRDITSVIRSLITQLSAQHDKIPLPLLQLYDTHQSGRQTVDDESYTTTLRSLVLTFHSVYIVFDALDESVDCDEVLQFLNTLHSWDIARLHILATSRGLHEIEESLKDITTDKICLQDAEMNRDITLYIADKLDNDKALANWPSDLKFQIQLKLLSGEEGMFRWVVCQLDMLRKCKSVTTIRKALKAGLPKSLDQTYDQILLSVEEENLPDVMKVLMTLTVTPSPLTLEEIVEILAVDLEATPPQFDEDSRLLDPRSILSMCSSLVTATTIPSYTPKGGGSPILKLAHASVADYLTLSPPTTHPTFHFTRLSARQFLGRTFLGYLLNPVFSSGHQPSFLGKRRKEYPLLKYCARFWPSYLLSEPSDPENHLEPETVELIKVFFETRHLFGGGNYAFWVGLLIPSSPIDLIQNTHPLYYASSFGLLDVVRIILETEKDLDINQLGGRAEASALHVAAYRGHFEVAKMLLERGADPNLTNGIKESPMYWAYANGNQEMMMLLRRYGAKQMFGTWKTYAGRDGLDGKGLKDFKKFKKVLEEG